VRKIPTALAVVLLIGVFAANVYRARKQSFTADEALTYNNYVSTPLRAALTDFDANNHMLNTLLEKASAAIFGVSEFTLRLPSLAGGGLYLTAVFLLCRRLFGDGPLLLVAVATLALNPFVLDFLSAARGYGMALGLFLWALELVLRYLDEARTERLFAASIALALAVAANLTLAFSGVALVAAVAAMLARRREWRTLVDGFLLPGFLLAFLLLAIPLSRAERGSFYVGSPTLAGTVDSLVVMSLYHSSPSQSDPEPAILPLRLWLRITTLRLAPAVPAISALALALLLFRRRGLWSPEQRFAALTAATFVGSLLLAATAHIGLGFPYPIGRTGLYLIPLFSLACFGLLRLTARNRWAARILLPAGAAFFSLCVFQFARQWNATYYLEWLYDADTKQIIHLIDGLRDRTRSSVSVSATWPVVVTVDFYRRSQHLEWLDLKQRQINKDPAEFYVLAADELDLAKQFDVVFRDDFAGVVLARATAPPARP